MSRARKKIYLSFFLICWLLNSIAHAKSWQPIEPGMEYFDLRYQSLSQWSHIHAFRIDLQKMHLSVLMAKDLPEHDAFVPTFRHYSHGLIAINGGFFNPNKTPLGLRISDKQILNPLRRISWWGVFFIQEQHAAISTPFEFHAKKNVEFAIQSGPRLLVAGQIPTLRPGYANRSALGIDDKGRVIIMVTENLPIATTDFARILKAPPFRCVDALNLDGGSSSQLYAKMPHFKLNVPGFSQVSDAIIVKRRAIED